MNKKNYIVVVMLMCILSFCGCNDSGIEYNVGFSDKAIFGSKEIETGGIAYGATKIINNLGELKELCKYWNNFAFEEEHKEYSSELSNKLREYNDEYFNSKSLVVCTCFQWTLAREPKVKRLTVNDSTLVIEISLKRGTYNTLAESILFLIEVYKDDVHGVTDIKIEETTRSKYK